MQRRRAFSVEVQVSRQFLADARDAQACLDEFADQKIAEGFVGPRGGRYVAVTEPRRMMYGPVDFTRPDVLLYRVNVIGEYVRPSHSG